MLCDSQHDFLVLGIDRVSALNFRSRSSALSLADLGGVPGARPLPPWDPILPFSHTFLPKSTLIRGPRPPPPPNGSTPSPREILDPPLTLIAIFE